MEKIGIGRPDALSAIDLGSRLHSRWYDSRDLPRRVQLIDAATVFPDVATRALTAMLSSPLRDDKVEAIEVLARSEVDALFARESLRRMLDDPDPDVAEAAQFWLRVCENREQSSGDL